MWVVCLQIHPRAGDMDKKFEKLFVNKLRAESN